MSCVMTSRDLRAPLSDTGVVSDTAQVTPIDSGSVTQTVVEANQVEGAAAPTLKLRLVKKGQVEKSESDTKPEGRRGVSWTTDTVDNEHMNKKKSKCCCIYVKPKKFGESDTESDTEGEDECEHCPGHKATKK